MKPITIIYWLRIALGMIAGTISAVMSHYLLNYGMDRISIILYAVSVTLLVYMATLYLLKAKFQNQVETPSKITMTGIGIYFLVWIVSYILIYTTIHASTVVTTI
ncbi:MAG: hypothetical protein LBE76_06425 [Nitrososphaerota archaeon]|jgi:hypothetical protein|nr:hypothetical protein [Nitrososphaerota archaeon]